MRRPASRPSAEPAALVRITRVGADGDGIGTAAPPPLGGGGREERPSYIPLTLPGELVEAHLANHRGELAKIVQPSPDRVSPPCPHFGACGGCTLQHWREAELLAWKSDQLEAALRRSGYEHGARLRPASTPPHARRRVDLALRRNQARVIVGLHRLRSAEVVDLHTCLVLDPRLGDLIAPLRALLATTTLLRREGSAIANLLQSGVDLLLRTDAEPTTAGRAALVRFAHLHHLPRIAWARGNASPEPICLLRPAVTELSGVTVAPPPGAFQQASPQGERAIVDAVLDGLGELKPRDRVVELYAGCGTLTFALAGHCRVHAFEGDAAALVALQQAANRSGLAGRITATRRDLARQPLTAQELKGVACVVLDPPHAGAPAQMPAIAAAKPKRVVYVSCNPAALGRDAHALRSAGYRLLSARLIDQFLWSARIESVCVFGI